MVVDGVAILNCNLNGGLSRDTDSGSILQLRGRIQE
jgi:hypothetical protein